MAQLHPDSPSLQRTWSRLTDADLEHIEADPAALADCLRERYGFSSERARAEALAFFQSRPRGAGWRPLEREARKTPADAESSYGLGRTGEARGREVPGDRQGHPGDSSETEARAARGG